MKRLVQVPILAEDCTCRIDESGCLLIANERAEVSIESPGVRSADSFGALRSRAPEPRAAIAALQDILDCDESTAWETVDDLVRAGFMVEHPSSPHADALSGEYVGHRLIHHFRNQIGNLYAERPLLESLQGTPNRGLATGFLLETFFLVRAASWTAEPVLSHRMSEKQRALLETFVHEESGHGDLLMRGCMDLGFSRSDLATAIPAYETESFNRWFHSCACHSVEQFAVSLVVPEVRDVPGDAQLESGGTPVVDIMDLIERVHGIATSSTAPFREHEGLDRDAEHGLLPVLLLAEAGPFSRVRAAKLFEVLDNTVAALAAYMDGIHRAYEGWNGELRRPRATI